jgi:signal transduction histidine kinase/ligand-binding sensor domain-containing protein
MGGKFLSKIISFFALTIFLSSVCAQRLPFKTYTAADGLATSITHHITRDSEGFLWFAGRGGLSRFDGTQFISYQFSETESAPLVHFFLESRDRKYFWIASDTGLYRVERRVETEARPIERTLREGVRRMRAKKVSGQGFWGLHETPQGELLAGSQGGLFLIENRDADEVAPRRLENSRTAEAEKSNSEREFVDGLDSSFWIGTDAGLVRRTPDGRFLTYDVPRVIPVGDESYAVRIDAAQRVWIVFRTGVFVLAPEPLEQIAELPNLTARVMPVKEFTLGGAGTVELPEEPGAMVKLNFESVEGRAGQSAAAAVQDIFQSSDGKIWIPAADALFVFTGNKYERERDANALPGTTRRIAEDMFGNIWFGTFSGVIKMTRRGLTTYAATSGLPDANVHLIQETPAGELLVVHGNWRVSRFTPEGFETSTLNLPENARFSWTSFPVVQDRRGALWSLQTAGLFRIAPPASFAALARQPAEKAGRAGEAEAPMFEGRYFYRAFNDRQGNIWFSANANEPERRTLLKFSPATGEWQDLSAAPGFPPNRLFASFAEDRAGNFWFGFSGSSGLVKFAGGRFTEIPSTENGLPAGSIFALHVDRGGRLWASSNEQGITRIDDPAAENLTFVRYTVNEGLSSNNVRCLAEDADSRIYAGTVRGVSRIVPATGKITQITTADGLAADFVQAAFRSSDGALWFGTSNGLSRYEPGIDDAPPAPRVFISDLQIAGVNYAVNEFGQAEVAGIETSATENNLQINFFSVGEAVRYQFKLDGAQSADWSAPTDQRAVNFANLPPGAYRFLVRAVAPNGAATETPAVIAFAIRPPFWKTGWFILLSALFVSLVLFAIYRFRTEHLRRVNAALTEAKRAEEELSHARQERLKELERVRRRIATDLHDDIGSSLTQIAVLSEVARTQAAVLESETLSAPLERIKGVSKELVEAMSDVVWAINPNKDNMGDLVQRMRLFASDVCAARQIHFELNAPPVGTHLRLGANIRREVFAIFKESVNNAVKYSEARNIIADFGIADDFLTLKIADDGSGFDAALVLSEDFAPETGGNGLVNMRRRAGELGGECRITSAPGEGTTVHLSAPLNALENI